MTSQAPAAAAAVLVATKHTPGTDDSWHGKIAREGPFPPELGRYRLYVGLFCPFAHRALIVRNLKGLQEFIPVTVVKPYPKGNDNGWPGWRFPTSADEYPGADLDPLFGAIYLHDLYFKDDPQYKGRYTVPLLWDVKNSVAVNNESLELLRDLQTAFDPLLPEGSPERALTLYPEALRAEIDRIGGWMQDHLNVGVYKAGFAETQAEYDEHVPYVFAALNVLERMVHANGGPYLLGAQMTELDVRMYATLIRFDTVYAQHFKCNLGIIRHDYPQLHNWLKNLYWNVPAFRETTDFKHIKENYTKSHQSVNPRAITPLGPWPHIEEGYEPDLAKVRVGGVKMPCVVDLEAVVQGKA
ncbi:hypothetical protein RB594_003747 [Gaeumannomyces avenae]